MEGNCTRSRPLVQIPSGCPVRLDADAMIQHLKTPMEDPRQTEDLLTAAADHPRLHLTLRRRSVTIRFLGTCEPRFSPILR